MPRYGNRGKGNATVSEWLKKSEKAAGSASYIRQVLVLENDLLASFDLKENFSVKESEFRSLMVKRWALMREVILDALFANAWKQQP